jgi:predicted dehydrogenase
MRFLVLGTGSIGQRHCRNLAALGHDVLAWDVDGDRLAQVEDVAGVSAAPSLEAGLGGAPAAALICTPPASHVELAHRALAAGAHLFVEKPISHAADGVPALLDEAEARGRIVMVGYNLRFLPSLRRVKTLLDDKRIGRVLAARVEFGAYLPDWRPGRDYRENYATRAAQGGGILLDAIHELDYLLWLLGDVAEVFCAAGHLSDLAGDTEDVVEATLRLHSGALAQVHLDYVQRVYRRSLEVVGDGGTILWDYPTHSVTVLAPDAPPSREDVGAEDDPNRMYLDEMRHFVECVEGRRAPLVDGREAFRSLAIVEAAKRSARVGRWETP